MRTARLAAGRMGAEARPERESARDRRNGAGTVTITGHGGDEIEAYLARPLTGTGRRRRGDPPHARLRPADEGDHPAVRRARLRARCAEPVLPGGARREPGRRRGGLPGPTAGCPTSGWSATSSAAAATCRRWTAPTARSGHRLLLGRPPDVPGRLQPAAGRGGGLLRRVRRARRPRACRCKVKPLVGLAPSCPARCSGCSARRTSIPAPEETAELGAELDPAGQAARVPHLRRRRARVLLGRPARLPAGGRRSTAGNGSGTFYGRLPGQLRRRLSCART